MILLQLGDIMYGTTEKGFLNTTDISNREFSSDGLMRFPRYTSNYKVYNNPLKFARDDNTASPQNPNIDAIFFGIVLGGGSTPATINDYKLENYYNEQFDVISVSGNFDNSQITLTLTVKNITENNVIVNEVGIACTPQYNFSINLNYPYMLLTRTVLSEPVVIQPQETKTFTVSIDLDKFIDNTTNI